MAALSSKSSKAAAAALVMLLALLAAGAGPAAAGAPSDCFAAAGWGALSNILYFPSCVVKQALGGIIVTITNNPFGPKKPGPPTGQGLSYGYYSYNGPRKCPSAEQIVSDTVKPVVAGNRSIGAGIIRLYFHDAFVRGLDASVLLNTTASNNTDTERTGPPNANSLQEEAMKLIDDAKAAIAAAGCLDKVSCADILAFAARDASYVLSNYQINYPVPAGRLDGTESFANETGQLPGPNLNEPDLKTAFEAQGLTVSDLVTLSGAHSIGKARCLFFTGRLPEMNTTNGYAQYLTDACNDGGPGFRVNQDNRTADVLDNQYYKNILEKYVLFNSDATLTSSETIGQVQNNANDAISTWYTDFGYSMVKLGNITNNVGKVFEIRKQCWKVNGNY